MVDGCFVPCGTFVGVQQWYRVLIGLCPILVVSLFQGFWVWETRFCRGCLKGALFHVERLLGRSSGVGCLLGLSPILMVSPFQGFWFED